MHNSKFFDNDDLPLAYVGAALILLALLIGSAWTVFALFGSHPVDFHLLVTSRRG